MRRRLETCADVELLIVRVSRAQDAMRRSLEKYAEELEVRPPRRPPSPLARHSRSNWCKLERFAQLV